MIISFNGIEKIGKQYYSSILNRYLKDNTDDCRKFSFPSYTTTSGKHLATLLKQFKEDDLLFLNPHSHNRYKKIANLLIKNYEDYRFHMESFLSKKNSVVILNNNYFSVLAHGLAADVSYNDLKKMLTDDFYLMKHKTLAFFLIAKNVKNVLNSTFEYNKSDTKIETITSTLSSDYINYHIHVNNYYKQIYLTLKNNNIITPILLEIDVTDPASISNTCSIIKTEVENKMTYY